MRVCGVGESVSVKFNHFYERNENHNFNNEINISQQK